MYVCLYVCMYICMHVCMYVCMSACMHVRMYERIRAYTYLDIHIHMHFVPKKTGNGHKPLWEKTIRVFGSNS